ncbi:MAG: hypothetical protein A3C35_06950 [Omnitrophica bacterium RIFCSPHIGHO2_02_FULL_46_11]|nr:MAG: hypothetical protein A3C35_06950 [Omnitrophica bacterium RIFCSPHIGHO2_02_FULL_46_11]
MSITTIRKCQSSDEPAARELIVNVLQREFPKDAQNIPSDDLDDIGSSYGKLGEAFFIALSNGKIVGTVGIKQEDERTAFLRRLFVAPEFRRKQIGSQLIERAVEFCREVGYDEIIFKTTSTMDKAVRLCEKRGFVPKAKLGVGPVQLLKFALFLKTEALSRQGKK